MRDSITPLDKTAPPNVRTETDSLGSVDVPSVVLWGAQTQRSLDHFSIGQDLMPREMITAYATLKKAAANVNHAARRLSDQQHRLIVQSCDEILSGLHTDMFPLHVWMTGSGGPLYLVNNESFYNNLGRLTSTSASVIRLSYSLVAQNFTDACKITDGTIQGTNPGTNVIIGTDVGTLGTAITLQ